MTCAFSPFTEGVLEKVERLMLTWVSGLLSLWQPLHKMDLPLVLAGLRALARTPTTREGHVPVLVVGIPQCCVIVLQDDFGEDAIPAVPVFL